MALRLRQKQRGARLAKFPVRPMRVRTGLVLVTLVLAGVLFVLASRAATPVASIEPESGDITYPASRLTNISDASGNGALQFQAAQARVQAMTIGSTLTSLGDPDPSGVIDEASGLVMSRKNTSGPIFWAHNDSGGTTQIFAISPGKGILASYYLGGAVNQDWEDISIGPGPVAGKDYIYVGDIGSGTNPTREIYRVAEPAVDINQSRKDATIASSEVEKFTYTVTYNDSEGFFIDPITGDGFVFQKVGGSSTRPQTSPVHRLPAAQFKAGGGTITPEFVANIRTLGVGNTNDGGITGADMSANGAYFAICNYQEVWAWSVNRAAGETISSVLQANTVGPYYRLFGSGWGSESIAFSNDRLRLYTLAEGSGASLKYVNLTYSN